MSAHSLPYQGSQGFHRPRPSISHAASTPAGFGLERLSEGSAAARTAGQPVKNVRNVDTKPLPSRPANHLQQHHIAYSRSYDSPLNQTHIDTPSNTEVVPLPDEDTEVLLLANRPALTSKFSFDNLTAMGEDVTESGGAFKRMVTKAWLQNISQAARNSTISTSSGSHRTAHSDPSSATSHVTVQASSHINQSPSSRPPTSFAHRFRRDREQQQTEVRGSSNPSKRAALLPPLPGTAVSKGDTSALIIGNPELVHPALNGYTLPNTTLGNGARRIGLPAEAFSMSNHRVYVPPASPPPRRSEDSVRSVQSSTSTAISYGSGCTSSTALSDSSLTNDITPSCASSSFGSARAIKHDRELPYLPLRLKSTMDDYKPSFESRLSPTDAVEQLVLTPQLPPESAKYIYKALYPASQHNETDGAGRPDTKSSGSEKTTPTTKDDIPFGHSANSRPTSPHPANIKGPIMEGQTSPPLSPPFACVSPLQATRKITSTARSSVSRPARSSTLQNEASQDQSKQSSQQAGDPISPFHAMLLQPIPSFPATLSDEEKLINVHVGGSRVYTTRLSIITAHPQSRLAVFLEDRLKVAQQQHNPEEVNTALQKTPIHDAPEEMRLTKVSQLNEARLSEKYQEPGTVVLNLPTSPVHALRSARASIYDDIPSDEGEDCDGQDEIFGEYANVKSFRDKLDVPMPALPNPRKNRLRFSRGRSESDYTTSDKSVDTTARSSECASTEGEDDFMGNFLDTTPDDESEDPFILQSAQPSPLPPAHDQTKRDDQSDKAGATIRKESSNSRYSNSSSSQLPSLSSSPDSSAYQADSPILSSGAAKQLMGGITATNGAFATLITEHEQNVLHPINLYLDRSSESYDAIFHFLRTGTLPRKLCLEQAVLAFPNKSDKQGEVSIQDVLDGLPSDTKRKLLPLILHPILSEINDLKEEAEYLGFSVLVALCELELSTLKKIMRWSRNIVTHPGLHVRSESEGGLNTRQGAQSPSRLLGKQANRPRPRLVGHRQFNSESKVPTKSVHTSNNQDNWI